jgi:hypothetical protein
VFVRRGAGGAAAVAAWAAAVAADPGTPDHVHFAAHARRGGPAARRGALGRLSGAPGAGRAAGLRAHPVDPRLVLGFGGAAAVGVLPLAAFGNGHTFFVQRLHEARARARAGLSWGCPVPGSQAPEALRPRAHELRALVTSSLLGRSSSRSRAALTPCSLLQRNGIIQRSSAAQAHFWQHAHVARMQRQHSAAAMHGRDMPGGPPRQPRRRSGSPARSGCA